MSENDLLSQLEEVDGELKELEHRGIILENILRNTMSSGFHDFYFLRDKNFLFYKNFCQQICCQNKKVSFLK